MKEEHRVILEMIKDYLDQHPSQRFGQAIFNLGINEFKQTGEFQLRDIYNDADSEIIERIKNRLELTASRSQ
ncbi:hypothetical protein LF252_04245 [Hymenobacter sp. BT728]|nr:hypothetical protein [Hymenobacter pini]